MKKFWFFLNLFLLSTTYAQENVYDFSIRVNDTLLQQIISNDSLMNFNNTQNFIPMITVDLGTINYKEKRSFDFFITNNEDKPLGISQNYWIEPHFEPEYTPSVIEKGETVKFTWNCLPIDRYTGHPSKREGYIHLGPIYIRVSFLMQYLPCNLIFDKTADHKNGYLPEKIISEFTIHNKAQYYAERDKRTFLIDSIVSTKNVIVKYDKESMILNPDETKTFYVEVTPKTVGRQKEEIWIYINNQKIGYQLYMNIKRKAKK